MMKFFAKTKKEKVYTQRGDNKTKLQAEKVIKYQVWAEKSIKTGGEIHKVSRVGGENHKISRVLFMFNNKISKHESILGGTFNYKNK